MDTRDHFSVTDFKLFKNELRIPQSQVKSDSAQGESILPALDDTSSGTPRSTYKCTVQY